MMSPFALAFLATAFIGPDSPPSPAFPGSEKEAVTAVPVMPSNPSGKKKTEPIVILVGQAEIRLPDGTQCRMTPVKTATGARIRIDTPGAVISAPQLQIIRETETIVVEASADGRMNVTSKQK